MTPDVLSLVLFSSMSPTVVFCRMISISYQKASEKSQRLQGIVSSQAASESNCLVCLYAC